MKKNKMMFVKTYESFTNEVIDIKGGFGKVKKAVSDAYNKLFPKQPKDFHEAYERFVPGVGKADTVYGEICRAISRLEYRYFNDGDVFNKGYGLETAGPSAEYLVRVFAPAAKIIQDDYFDDHNKKYENMISELKNAFVSMEEAKKYQRMKNNDDSNSESVGEFIDLENALEIEAEEYINDNWVKITNDIASEYEDESSGYPHETDVVEYVVSEISTSLFTKNRIDVNDVILKVVDNSGIMSDIKSDIDEIRNDDDDDDDNK